MEATQVPRGGARPRPPRPAPPTSISQRTSETAYEKLKRLHDEAFLYIDQGLTCDEQGQGAQAVTLYKKGLRCIDKALAINFNSNNDTEKEQGNKKIKKMKTSQSQIQSRVDALQQDPTIARALSDPPPSYEVTINPVGMSAEEVELGNSIMGGISRSPTGATADGWEVFSINDGVQIFFISPEGYVSAPSYPSSLKIIRLKEDDRNTSDVEGPPAFIQVGDWSYPLVPGCSPVLHANWGAYVFPDLESGQGAAVGVIIPDAVPEEARQKLEKTLQSLTAMKIQTPEEERARLPAAQAVVTPVTPSASEESLETEHRGRIAGGIVKAAEWMSWGLQEGAKKTGELIHKGTAKLRENIKPQSEPSKIDPRLQQGAYYAKRATSVGVRVSSLIVTKLGEVTMALGREMAPYVKEHGAKIVPQSFTRKSQDGGPSKMDTVLDVAKGGLEGWAKLYIGLETAAGILAANISKETVATVQHKYGKEAGTFADSTVGAVGNCAMTAMNVRHLGVKAIAKRVVKDTGKAVIHQSGQDIKYEGTDVDARGEPTEETQNENNVNLEGATAASYSTSNSKRDYPPQKL